MRLSRLVGWLLVMVSLPFLTVGSFDPFLIIVGLTIIGAGSITVVLSYGTKSAKNLSSPKIKQRI
jgi:hypothetical protein